MHIISLSPSITEILFSLGYGVQIVGVSKDSDYPSAALSKEQFDIDEIDFGKLDALAPDVIFVSEIDFEILEELESRYRVIRVVPQTLDDVYNSIKYIGRELGREDKANALVERMKAQFLVLSRKATSKKKCVVAITQFALGKWVPKIIEMAGGISLLKEGEDGREIGPQEDYVVVDKHTELFRRFGPRLVDALDFLIKKLHG